MRLPSQCGGLFGEAVGELAVSIIAEQTRPTVGLEQRVDKRRCSSGRQNQKGGQGKHHNDQRQQPELAVLLQEAHEFADEAALRF